VKKSKTNTLIRYAAPFAIVGIVAISIWNLFSHGQIQHPGKSTYTNKCAQCHGDNGEGIKSLTPPLANADFAMQNFDSLPCWIKNGMNHPIKVNGVDYDQPMYPNEIDEIQTANVINFMSSEFFNCDSSISSIWVKQKWKGCE
jgi:cytochrome c1